MLRPSHTLLLVTLITLAALPGMASAQGTPRAAEIVAAGDLICDLQPSGTTQGDRLSAAARTPDDRAQMLVIERRQDRLRALSSLSARGRPLVMRSGDTGVHFVEELNGSVRVTSLLACEQPGGRDGCQRWGAVQAWHFDTAVHRDPDLAFRRLPGTSFRGSCEPWHLGPRQALSADASER